MIVIPSHIGHPVGALLPQFTFITGPNGSGKTTLGSQLFTHINGLQLFSFAEPIRQALVGMFYNGDITIDLTQEHFKSLPIPGFTTRTHRETLNALGDWFRAYFGEDAIGQWAKHRCLLDAEYFERFVFDDARRLNDLLPLVTEYSADNCLLIKLSRPGVSFNQPQHFVHDEGLQMLCHTIELVNDGGIGDLLPKLKATLEIENTIAAK